MLHQKGHIEFMDERKQLDQSARVLRLAEDAHTPLEHAYYLAVAGAIMNSYGHAASIVKATQGVK